MFLATTALLLQFLALPNHAIPAVTGVAAVSAVSEVTSAQPEVADAGSQRDDSPTEQTETLSASAEPQPNVTYMPARLILEPVAALPAESSSFIGTPVTPMVSPAEAEGERRWKLHQRRVWMTLNMVQSGAATFDAWSTRRVISSGQGRELNPMLRPFAGNASLYVAIQVAPLVLDYVGHRMMMSHNSWLRRTWWVPQAAGTALSFAGGINNLAVMGAH